MSRIRLFSFLAGLLLLGFGLNSCASAPPVEAPSEAEPEATAAALEPVLTPSGVIPTATQTGEILIPVTGGGGDQPPALLESRRLTLEFPPRIRVGDTDTLRLTLEMDDLGDVTPTVEVEGHMLTGETVQIPDLYASHTIIAEARLDLAGMLVQPPDPVSETLFPGQPVTFYWSIRPSEPGNYRGTVWLYLRFLPLAGGNETRSAISAQPVEIRAVTFLGLAGGPARLLGAAGSLLGTVLGFPFLEDILRWFLRRLRPQPV